MVHGLVVLKPLYQHNPLCAIKDSIWQNRCYNHYVGYNLVLHELTLLILSNSSARRSISYGKVHNKEEAEASHLLKTLDFISNQSQNSEVLKWSDAENRGVWVIGDRIEKSGVEDPGSWVIRCRKAKFLSNQKQRYEVLGVIRGGKPRFFEWFGQEEITELEKLADRYRNINILN